MTLNKIYIYKQFQVCNVLLVNAVQYEVLKANLFCNIEYPEHEYEAA